MSPKSDLAALHKVALVVIGGASLVVGAWAQVFAVLAAVLALAVPTRRSTGT